MKAIPQPRPLQLLAALSTFLALAAPTMTAAAMNKADCAKAREPARCEAAQAAREACRDLHGSAFRQCTEDLRLHLECAAAAEPRRCESRQKQRAACKSKRGRAGKECRQAVPDASQ
jgi:hypothetical protein